MIFIIRIRMWYNFIRFYYDIIVVVVMIRIRSVIDRLNHNGGGGGSCQFHGSGNHRNDERDEWQTIPIPMPSNHLAVLLVKHY